MNRQPTNPARTNSNVAFWSTLSVSLVALALLAGCAAPATVGPANPDPEARTLDLEAQAEPQTPTEEPDGPDKQARNPFMEAAAAHGKPSEQSPRAFPINVTGSIGLDVMVCALGYEPPCYGGVGTDFNMVHYDFPLRDAKAWMADLTLTWSTADPAAQFMDVRVQPIVECGANCTRIAGDGIRHRGQSPLHLQGGFGVTDPAAIGVRVFVLASDQEFQGVGVGASTTGTRFALKGALTADLDGRFTPFAWQGRIFVDVGGGPLGSGAGTGWSDSATIETEPYQQATGLVTLKWTATNPTMTKLTAWFAPCGQEPGTKPNWQRVTGPSPLEADLELVATGEADQLCITVSTPDGVRAATPQDFTMQGVLNTKP